jgi:hypothetical protein
VPERFLGGSHSSCHFRRGSLQHFLCQSIGFLPWCWTTLPWHLDFIINCLGHADKQSNFLSWLIGTLTRVMPNLAARVALPFGSVCSSTCGFLALPSSPINRFVPQELHMPLNFFHEFLEGGVFFHLGISVGEPMVLELVLGCLSVVVGTLISAVVLLIP